VQSALSPASRKRLRGIRMLSESVRANARESDIGTQLDEIAKANPGVAIGSHPFFDLQHGPSINVVLRASDGQRLQYAKRAVEDMLERVQGAQSGKA
jgi:molybdopterin-biosynthesis enzyme MoeA-like protein